jgi:uncharacterized protein (DUF433 family)
MYLLASEQLIVERILQSLPTLTEEQVRAALAYWRANDKEIGHEIAEEDEFLAKIAG